MIPHLNEQLEHLLQEHIRVLKLKLARNEALFPDDVHAIYKMTGMLRISQENQTYGED